MPNMVAERGSEGSVMTARMDEHAEKVKAESEQILDDIFGEDDDRAVCPYVVRALRATRSG